MFLKFVIQTFLKKMFFSVIGPIGMCGKEEEEGTQIAVHVYLVSWQIVPHILFTLTQHIERATSCEIYRTKLLLLFLCIHVFHKNKLHVICTKFENLHSFTLFSTSVLSSKIIWEWYMYGLINKIKTFRSYYYSIINIVLQQLFWISDAFDQQY